MIFDKLKQHFSTGATITGANMQTINNAQFNLLSDAKHNVEYYPQEIELLKRFESKMADLYNRAENGSLEEVTINPMEIQNGKVVLRDGQICHRCTASMETLSNISVGGVLASEWFGQQESEREGFLCVFLSKRFTSANNNINKYLQKALSPNNNSCFLYFDEKNPLMQALLSIDFFEYEKVKKTNPEQLSTLYSPAVIELYDTIIEPMSPAGKNMHDYPDSQTFGWIAIPGGIPAQLVNGICLHSKHHTQILNNIQELQKMYPNATIFDEKQTIIALPLLQSKQDSPKSD